MNRLFVLLLLSALSLFSTPVKAQGKSDLDSTAKNSTIPADHQVRVSEAYVDLYSGPGRGFPKIHVAERGELLRLIKRHTSWIQVAVDINSNEDFTGWLPIKALRRQLVDDIALLSNDFEHADFAARSYELGFAAGQFADEPLVSLRAGYRLNPYVSLELTAEQAIGDFASADLYGINLQLHPFNLKRWSPYASMGFGTFDNQPRATVIDAEPLESDSASIGLGLRYYLTRRFMARLEYRDVRLFLDDNDQDSKQHWTLGFSFFFGGSEDKKRLGALPDIESDDFEAGVLAGAYSLEDFAAEPVYGARLAYHVSEDVFMEVVAGQSQVDDSDFRERGLPLFPGSAQVDLNFYHLSAGYNLFSGEYHFDNKKVWQSQFYAVAGLGNTQIRQQDYFTTVLGLGVRVRPRDWFALHLDFKDHVFDFDLLGTEKTAHNFVVSFGATAFF